MSVNDTSKQTEILPVPYSEVNKNDPVRVVLLLLIFLIMAWFPWFIHAFRASRARDEAHLDQEALLKPTGVYLLVHIWSQSTKYVGELAFGITIGLYDNFV
jgi:hypothetical protein